MVHVQLQLLPVSVGGPLVRVQAVGNVPELWVVQNRTVTHSNHDYQSAHNDIRADGADRWASNMLLWFGNSGANDNAIMLIGVTSGTISHT